MKKILRHRQLAKKCTNGAHISHLKPKIGELTLNCKPLGACSAGNRRVDKDAFRLYLSFYHLAIMKTVYHR
jgi:hypothetical protein